MGRVYATRDDLLNYPPPASVTVPDNPEAGRLLARASERVDEAAQRSFYEVDEAGLPADAAVAEALRLAACAQAIWWLSTGGDDTDAATAFATIRAGRVDLTRRVDAPRFAPQALTHLRLASLYPGPIVDGAL